MSKVSLMNSKLFKLFFYLSLIIIFTTCSSEKKYMGANTNIIFLHHSTGRNIWNGGLPKLANKLGFDGDVVKWFDSFNKVNQTNYIIEEMDFPKKHPYGWNNYPFDYYNIWVKNAGNLPYKEEPTLEILTKKFDVIIFKHCYPVSHILADSKDSDINSDIKTLDNYKLQYEALKQKLLEFPDKKFIVWTPTALVKNRTTEEEAKRANEFYHWVKNIWDIKGDNIFLWDFRDLQTEGDLYFKDEYAVSKSDSHPNSEFSARIAPYFCNRIVDVIEGRGDIKSITGK